MILSTPNENSFCEAQTGLLGDLRAGAKRPVS